VLTSTEQTGFVQESLFDPLFIEGEVMDDHIDLDDIDDIEDIPDIQNVEDIQRKVYIRDFVNPFEFFNEKEFKRRFRFSKNIVRNLLLPRILHGLEKNILRGLPVDPAIQLLIALRFYATGCFQVGV